MPFGFSLKFIFRGTLSLSTASNSAEALAQFLAFTFLLPIILPGVRNKTALELPIPKFYAYI